MQRVLVLGPPGSGKSTFARRLGQSAGLPVIHLDQLFWNAGWRRAPNDVYLRRLEDALAGERWIIDGDYSATLDRRLPRADTIILLQRSRAACLWRVMKRIAGGHGRVRPDMAAGCPERFDLEFVRFIWRTHADQARRTAEALAAGAAGKKTVALRSDRQAAAFLRAPAA